MGRGSEVIPPRRDPVRPPGIGPGAPGRPVGTAVPMGRGMSRPASSAGTDETPATTPVAGGGRTTGYGRAGTAMTLPRFTDAPSSPGPPPPGVLLFGPPPFAPCSSTGAGRATLSKRLAGSCTWTPRPIFSSTDIVCSLSSSRCSMAGDSPRASRRVHRRTTKPAPSHDGRRPITLVPAPAHRTAAETRYASLRARSMLMAIWMPWAWLLISTWIMSMEPMAPLRLVTS
jgi:hypothetical protein